MKIAHLILAHKNPGQIERLIKALSHPAFHFFIHLDGKADFRSFAYLEKLGQTKFIEKRAKIYWAGYGTIQATINGFEEIVPLEFDYINVISGQDFPLKSADFIYHFISSRKGRQFITCDSIETKWQDAAHRVREYHLINWRIPGKFRLGKLANKLLPKRKFPFDFEIVGRANWFALDTNAARFILNFIQQNPAIVRYFKLCWGADEFMFSTILYNSHFKDQLVENFIYVDWTGQTQGHPRVLDHTDLPALLATDKLFGRKFDATIDGDIITKLEMHLQSGLSVSK